jgi:hypothetical protein
MNQSTRSEDNRSSLNQANQSSGRKKRGNNDGSRHFSVLCRDLILRVTNRPDSDLSLASGYTHARHSETGASWSSPGRKARLDAAASSCRISDKLITNRITRAGAGARTLSSMRQRNKFSSDNSQSHGSDCDTSKKASIVSPFDEDDEFRQNFAAACREEIRFGTIIGFAFACFVLTVYIRTMYPSGIDDLPERYVYYLLCIF